MKEIVLDLSRINKSKKKVNMFIKAPYLNLVNASKSNEKETYLIELDCFLKGCLKLLTITKEEIHFSEVFIKENIYSEENIVMYDEIIDDLLFKEEKLNLVVVNLHNKIKDSLSGKTTLNDSIYDPERMKVIVDELVYLYGESSYVKDGIETKGLNFLLDLL